MARCEEVEGNWERTRRKRRGGFFSAGKGRALGRGGELRTGKVVPLIIAGGGGGAGEKVGGKRGFTVWAGKRTRSRRKEKKVGKVKIIVYGRSRAENMQGGKGGMRRHPSR